MSLKNDIRALSDDELGKLLHSADRATASGKLALREYQRRQRGNRLTRNLMSIMRRLLKRISSFLRRARWKARP